MLKHVVMWKLKDEAEGASRAENARRMKERLEALPAKVPGIRYLEVGLDVDPSPEAWHVVLLTEFAGRADLDAYQKHPEHVAVATFIGKVRSERAVVDFEA